MAVAHPHPLAGLADEVLRLHGRLLAADSDLGAADGLTGAQVLVLTAVVNAGRPPTVPQIGRSLGHTGQSVQRIADALTARGLLASRTTRTTNEHRCSARPRPGAPCTAAFTSAVRRG
jgi:DNA-binding MarR family transcriptional regulator